MPKRVWLAFLLFTTSAAAAPPPAAPAPANKDPAIAALNRLALSIQRVRLDNGLRVVMNVDNSSPTVAVSVTYDVGSRNEGAGQSGFAHLFEHMMFQGSRNVQKGQHFQLVSERGGTLNGTTSADRTNYYELLPASELELALFLEADRMRWLSVTAENFENQRAVVKEEYRMRVDNTPFARASMRLDEMVFANYSPYAHPTIGSMQDLDAAKLDWVAAFYRSHYAPNNAVLTIAGDFDPDRALELARKYFGPAERRDVPPFSDPAPSAAVPGVQPAPASMSAAVPTSGTPQATQSTLDPNANSTAGANPNRSPATPRRDVVEDKNVNTPGILWGYRIPPMRSPDHYALELAALLLTDGESSRLYQKLVRDRALLQEVSAWTEDHRGPDEFGLMGVLTEKATIADVEQAFQAELTNLEKTPPSAEELARAKARLRHDFLFGLQSNGSRSIQLGEYEVFFGDARLLTRELGAYLDVTAADIQRVVKQYLKPEARFTVEVQPARVAGGAP